MAMTQKDLDQLTVRVRRYVSNMEKYRRGFAQAESERKTLLVERDDSTWREAFRIAADDNLRLRMEVEKLKRIIKELEARPR